MRESIAYERNTGGTETSKYPEEKKETSIPSVAASERDRAQAYRRKGKIAEPTGKRTKESNSLVGEIRTNQYKRVPQDTRNPVGTQGDHPLRLNTTW